MEDTTKNIEDIKKLVGENRLPEAIGMLKRLLEGSSLESQAIVIAGKLSKFQNDTAIGTLRDGEADVQRSQISSSILELVSLYESGATSTASDQEEDQNSDANVQNSENVIVGNINTQGGSITIGNNNSNRTINQGDKSMYIEKNDGDINIS